MEEGENILLWDSLTVLFGQATPPWSLDAYRLRKYGFPQSFHFPSSPSPSSPQHPLSFSIELFVHSAFSSTPVLSSFPPPLPVAVALRYCDQLTGSSPQTHPTGAHA